MDEYNGDFRIATTTGSSWSGDSLNHLFVLNEDMEIVGSVDDLAKGERIYSVRFMGNRAYMVTFKQVDPLFVIDLSDSENPKVLGYLKVTGYSSYLHPYDENHIIGVGKEASEEGRVQGVKIALFDVSDVSNPKEIGKYEISEGWSDSEALWDHKAFLFDKERGLLVIPVSYNKQIEVRDSEGRLYPNYEYWQGAFVFDVDLRGIDLRGKIQHESKESDNYYYSSGEYVRRSLYMDDILYTISQRMIKANGLDDLGEINKVELPYSQEDYPIYYAESGVGVGGVEVSTPRIVVD